MVVTPSESLSEDRWRGFDSHKNLQFPLSGELCAWHCLAFHLLWKWMQHGRFVWKLMYSAKYFSVSSHFKNAMRCLVVWHRKYLCPIMSPYVWYFENCFPKKSHMSKQFGCTLSCQYILQNHPHLSLNLVVLGSSVLWLEFSILIRSLGPGSSIVQRCPGGRKWRRWGWW